VIRENNRIGRERQKEYYNVRTKLVTFQPGDMVYLKEMVNSRQKARNLESGGKVIRRLSDLNYLVKLSRTKEIVVNVDKMKKCFRQTALRPMIKQRSMRNRAEDKLEMSETYGTTYTRPDSQTPHSGATERDMTENLTQDTDCKPYHHSCTPASSCGNAEVMEGGRALLKYPMGNQAGEYHQDVGDSPQLSEGEGGSMSEPVCTEVVDPETTPSEPLEGEGVTNAGEKVESTPRYNLRPRPGRNV
jgi:hypothetical protein